MDEILKNSESSEDTAAEGVIEEAVEIDVITAEVPATKPRLGEWVTYNRKPLLIAAAVVVVAGLLFYFKGLFVAALVEGRPISRFKVISEIERSAGKETLEGLVRIKLIDLEAEKQGISVSKDEINEEISKLEQQVTEQQGVSLDTMLSQQNLTREDLQRRIKTQKKLEKILGDAVMVTDEEVEQYITENSINLTEGDEAVEKENIRDYLKNSKFSTEAESFFERLTSERDIRYFVEY